MKVGMNMNENDFDIDFDFEKEYGTDPVSEDPIPQPEEDFDLRSILNSDFGAVDSIFGTQPEEEDYDLNDLLSDLPHQEPFSQPVQEPAYEPEPEPQAYIPDPQPSEEPEASEPPVRRERRRKPRSKMRQFKDDLLPQIIMGAAALLILIFIIGSISRAIGSAGKNKDSEATGVQQNQEERVAQEAKTLLEEAALLAAGYDYDAAIEKLDSFTGDPNEYTDFIARRSEYEQAKSQLVAHNDPSEVTNLSFHVLIADPSRAFSNQEFGNNYNMNFVTIDEFQQILEQLYANDYVLVSMDDFIDEAEGSDGSITYASKTLYLPDGKKPIMITETMVNYFAYMIDGNSDGTPDKDGAGFASRLVVDENGDIKAEMVDSTGQTVTGNYDLVPILNDFIDEHPDFSYQGAKATLAVCGKEGVFGYRTNTSVIDSKGQSYYDEQVAAAKTVVAALRADGYEIACYTYNNLDYGKYSASEIKADLDLWTKEVVPVLGAVDTLVYAKSSDIAAAGAYSGSKYNVLYDAGFRYFIGSGTKASAEISTGYVRQNRLMVTGSQMYYSASIFSSYFDSKSVLNSQRGDIPQ